MHCGVVLVAERAHRLPRPFPSLCWRLWLAARPAGQDGPILPPELAVVTRTVRRRALRQCCKLPCLVVARMLQRHAVMLADKRPEYHVH